ncbi:hypothetical protein ACNOYE_03075 [Nannocystaceae bacterium ST9]
MTSPWLGRASFAPPRASAPERWVAETGEERRWRRIAPRLFAPGSSPGPVIRLINHIVVTPMAHVTLTNLDYQIYLNQVLHTSGGAWLGHLVCIPLNVGLLFYALAVYVSPIASLILLALLGAWYLAMAIRLRSAIWGLLSLTTSAGLCALAIAAASWATGWYTSPILWIAAVSSLQAYTHLFEANVPPRANFERHWLPLREFLWGAPESPALHRLAKLAWTPIGGLWGTLDEWWASSKLLPLYLLELLWWCGYRPALRQRYRERSLAVLASGDPALDWVGPGGGASVDDLGERVGERAHEPIAAVVELAA